MRKDARAAAHLLTEIEYNIISIVKGDRLALAKPYLKSLLFEQRVGARFTFTFVTELFDADGNYLRETGREYGTVTGRPRRCGWLDAFMLRYSARLNSLDYLAITRLDILDGLPKIKMCVGYKYQGEVLKRIPASLNVLAQVEPIYEEFEGWLTDISSIRKYEDLPANAKKYLERLSEVAGVELGIVSVGPNREQTIVLKELL